SETVGCRRDGRFERRRPSPGRSTRDVFRRVGKNLSDEVRGLQGKSVPVRVLVVRPVHLLGLRRGWRGGERRKSSCPNTRRAVRPPPPATGGWRSSTSRHRKVGLVVPDLLNSVRGRHRRARSSCSRDSGWLQSVLVHSVTSREARQGCAPRPP